MITRKIKIGKKIYSHSRSIQNIAHHIQSLFDVVISERGGGSACPSLWHSQGPNNCNDGFIFDRNDDVVVIYKIERDELTNVPQVTYVIRVDNTLRVKKLFHKNAPIALPAWFHQGRNTILSSCNMLQPMINHMTLVESGFSQETGHRKFKLHPLRVQSTT